MRLSCKAWGGLQIRLAHCNSAGLKSCHVAHCFSWKLCRLRFMGIHFAFLHPSSESKTWTWPEKVPSKSILGTVELLVNSRRCWLVKFYRGHWAPKTFKPTAFSTGPRRGARCVRILSYGKFQTTLKYHVACSWWMVKPCNLFLFRIFSGFFTHKKVILADTFFSSLQLWGWERVGYPGYPKKTCATIVPAWLKKKTSTWHWCQDTLYKL